MKRYEVKTETRSIVTGELLYNKTMTVQARCEGEIRKSIQTVSNIERKDNGRYTTVISIKEKPYTEEELTEMATCEARKEKIKAGTTIDHKAYGTGTVTEVDGNIITVRFSDGEVRKFDAKYAPATAFKVIE